MNQGEPTTWPHLRPLAAADEAFYIALYRCPVAMHHVGGPIPCVDARRGFETALAWTRAAPPWAWYWVAADAGTALPVGLVGVVPDRDAPTSAELGVLLAEGMDNRGYATAAIASVCQWAFADAGLARLWTRHAGAHVAARRLMQRTRFVRCSAHAGDAAEWRWQRLAVMEPGPSQAPPGAAFAPVGTAG